MPTNQKPEGFIGIHRNKNAAIAVAGDKFYCIIGYKPSPDGEFYDYTREVECDHPLEALRAYEGTFFPHIDVWFDNWLENHGYPRYSCTKRREV